MSRKILLIALVIFLVGGNITCAPERRGVIGARNLYYTYLDNQINADNKFKNKILVVDGEIGLIGRYREGVAYLVFRHLFASEGTFDIQSGGVLCEFDKKAERQIINARQGHSVRVEGKCRGVEGRYVILEHCTLIKFLE